jgi:putative tryptophan/tyrosine transport system substrate-binding protein
MMRRREFIATLGGAAVMPVAALAQQAPRPARIGVLVLQQADGHSLVGHLREALRNIGYIEGQNLQFDVRSADGTISQLPNLASDLVLLKSDVILATFTPCALAARRATDRIPIVAISVGDPIGSGLAATLSKPGGNVTGLTNLGAETAGKSVELLRDMMPSLRRVAALANPADPFTKPFVEQVQLAGRISNVEIKPIAMARGPEDFETAFATIMNEQAEAVVVQGIFFSEPIADLAIKHRLPTASVVRAFSSAGGLITYGASVPDLFRRSAVYARKILQGIPPSDLPIEQPTRFELVINLKTAKAIGLAIPPAFIARADEVIE